ncbi:3-deoxy-7-phosphoheptulonate synthase [Sphingomonas mesophila]|uniref:3-deoxy-7-phosphoheptulonate synthase n=1 Tax=Sphingomonas mesophila TaxID=2303576 RepID=UPI000E595B86|nr:3-deoxy-7-phosphoheptulonate synthase [Sphingomonas mesophila]
MTAVLDLWQPSDWRALNALQQPDYGDPGAVERALAEVAEGGPLVDEAACAALRAECAAAARGRAFIIQAGDCAESLAAEPGAAAEAMAGVIGRLAAEAGGPVVRIGRIGGQFAKPRSSATETRGGEALPVWRGDMINGVEFSAGARAHDPTRLVAAYRHSVATLDRLRRQGGMYASHEALVLPYEEALCFRGANGRWWAGSGHALWIGERTRQLDGAHVAFAAGVANVVGVKCGPSLGADEMVRLAERLDPEREAGRLVLIARLGAERVGDVLPGWLERARAEGLAAAWMVDPMHGNTRRIGARKQRRVADVLAEARDFAAICRAAGVVAAGVHLEVTAGGAAECVGADGIDPGADFPCDPRLTEDEAAAVLAAVRC